MIREWLEQFKSSWERKDINQVLDLFSDNIEYWETPYQKIASKDELRKEWRAILSQDNIKLDLHIFSSTNSKHTVLWRLSYTSAELERQNWAGTYLIELNKEGKCTYFHQTGEKQRYIDDNNLKLGDKVDIEEPIVKQQQALNALINHGKKHGPIKGITDPVAWQREQRSWKDRRSV